MHKFLVDEDVPRDGIETPIRELVQKTSRAAVEETLGNEESEDTKKGMRHLQVRVDVFCRHWLLDYYHMVLRNAFLGGSLVTLMVAFGFLPQNFGRW